MADENKDLETLTDPAADEGAETEQPEIEAPAGETAQLPFALGEDATAGEQASEPSDAAEADPTTEVPAADADLGTSESETPVAEGSSEAPAEDSTPAGDAAPAYAPVDQAPAATGTPAAADAPNDATASDVVAPEADAQAQDPATSTSTGIGSDNASEPPSDEVPSEQPAPAPSPAPSTPGLFDHGTAIAVPSIAVDVSAGYPVLNSDASPVHPQGFHPLVNDGVGDDAGKAAAPPEYPMPAGSVDVIDGTSGNKSGDSAAEPAQEAPLPESDAGEPSAIPPHVESKLSKMMDKLASLEAKVSQLVHELLD